MSRLTGPGSPVRQGGEEVTSPALDMMYALVLESGRRWGEAASDHQVADAEAIFSPERPHLHFVTRPRGGSKTTDTAGMALAWVAAEAPPMANGHVVASNTDQAAILIDAAAGFVARTPELQGIVTVESERIVGPQGAWVRVLTQSDSGSWGLRDAHLLILDEFAQWPDTRGARRVYTAVRTTVQKVPGCRLIILTSAGTPDHWSYTSVFQRAATSDLWRVSEMPGPVPWQDPIELEALRAELLPSEYERLVLNRWTQDENQAITEEDWDRAAVRAWKHGRGWRTAGPRPGVRYVITVDVGILVDATALVVAHAEPLDPERRDGPQVAVVDHLERWAGSKKRPVRVSDIEDWVVATAAEYNRARVFADPSQFRGGVQNLTARGVRAQVWNFTSTSVGKVASSLVQSIRDGRLRLPDVPQLRDELLRVRLRESSPGVTRLDHDRGAHDDQAVAIGMAVHELIGRDRFGAGAGFVQFMRDEMAKKAEGPPRARAARCDHRYRSGTCLLCGSPQEATACPSSPGADPARPPRRLRRPPSRWPGASFPSMR